MIDAVGEIFPFAIGVALSPLPVIAVVLLLLSKQGRSAGTVFLLGRFATVLVVAVVFALFSEWIDESTGSSTAVAIIRIVGGLALMAFAVSTFLKRPKGDDEAQMPGWMESLDNTSAVGALRLSVLISVANPKELVFGVGSGLTIGNADLSPASTIVVALVYATIACLSVAVPVVAFLVAGDRIVPSLQAARAWLVRNYGVLVSVVMLVIGALLVGGGITKL